MTIKARIISTRNRFNDVLNTREPLLRKFTAIIGDGEGNVYPDLDEPTYIFIRRTGRGRVERVRNTRVQAVHDLRVIVGFLPENQDVLQVISIDDVAYGSSLGGHSYVRNHHQQHELHNPQGGGDTTWIWSQQFLYMLGQVTDPVSASIQVRSGLYAYGGVYKLFSTTTTMNLTTFTPAVGEAVMVLVSIDVNTQNLVYSPSAAFLSTIPKDMWASQVPIAPDNSLPIAAVYVENGATTFDWDVILDWRVFINVVGDVEPHSILSHTDTLAGTIVRGDILVGGNTVPPKIIRIVHPGIGGHLRTNANDVFWDPDIYMLHTRIIGTEGGGPSIRFDNGGHIGFRDTKVVIGGNQAVAMLDVLPDNVARVGVIIKGQAGHTANLKEYQDDGGDVLSHFNPDGSLHFDASLTLTATRTDVTINPMIAGNQSYQGLNIQPSIVGSGTAVGANFFVSQFGTNVNPIGLNLAVEVNSGFQTTVNITPIGARFLMAYSAFINSLTVPLGISSQIAAPITQELVGTLTVTEHRGIDIINQGFSQCTDSYAIYIASQLNSANESYAIYTNVGKVRFGDVVEADTRLRLGSGSTYEFQYSEEGDLYSENGKAYFGSGLLGQATSHGSAFLIRQNIPTTTLVYFVNAAFTTATQTITKVGETFVSDGVVVGDFVSIITSTPNNAGLVCEILTVTETTIQVSLSAAGSDPIPDMTNVNFGVFSRPTILVLDNSDLHFNVGPSNDASFKILVAEANNDHAIHYTVVAGVDGHNAIELDVDPDTYGDVSAFKINYDATAFSAGISGTGIDVVMDNIGTSGGDIHVIDVAKTDTGNSSVEIEALVTHEGIDPIAQYLGEAASIAKAFIYDDSGATYTDVTTAFGSAGTDVQLFIEDDDQILIASLTKFDEVNVILAILSSTTIAPTFHYIEDDGDWIAFSPSDDTNGFQQNGAIRFESDLLTTWGQRTVNEVTGEVGAVDYYWIKVTRTRNNVPTPPTEDTIKVTTIGTKHVWDSVGRLGIKTYNQSGEPDTGDLPAGRFCFWTDTDDSKLYICYNHGGTIKTVEMV